ncbi:MAG: hypothetical protein JNM53_17640 [Gemmatimonadetes bacterium]|nr:hypothetical protein [Gemmatimonadota bacterium]
MSAAVHAQSGADHTDLPYVLRAAVKLGVLESVAVLVIGLVSRSVEGVAETALLGVLVTAAILAVTFLPGLWTRAATIEGIAGAAGIGLTATVVFLVVDVAAFQPFGLYTNRWREIGGGSNWWYHPILWMVGTYLPWLGAWILANQSAKNGAPSLAGGAVLAIAASAVCMVLGVLFHVPGAGWNVPTFGVSFLPGLAVATAVSGLGARRK